MKPVFIIDNERIIERRVIANEFNKYFVSFASKLNDEVEIQSGDFSNFLPRSQLRGGGGNGYFFVKLDFEIAVDQQTKTSDRTFEGVPDPNRQTVPAGQPRPYLVQIRPNLAKYPEHAPYPVA